MEACLKSSFVYVFPVIAHPTKYMLIKAAASGNVDSFMTLRDRIQEEWLEMPDMEVSGLRGFSRGPLNRRVGGYRLAQAGLNT